MKHRLSAIILFALAVCFCLLFSPELTYGQRSQYTYPYSSNQASYGLYPNTDTLSPTTIMKPAKKRPWLAAGEVFALNIGVWLFDLYILDQDYARITLNSMKRNLKTGFVWDNDNFSINLLSHPYHGNLYFNSARSNGMNFWESIPFTFGGSLMWELFMETEPPSINDLFSTTIGGVALGEITFRLSSLILDDSKRGGERVWREFLGTAVSPMRTLNRIGRGEFTKRYAQNSFEHERMPVDMSVGVGWRYLAKNNYLFQGDNGMFIDLSLNYGDPFYYDTYKPFDYFTLKAMLNIIGGQPIVGSVNAMGMLWGRSEEPMPGHDMTIGVFQHFDFYQTSKLKKSEVVPFEIAQSAAIGGGLLYKFPQIGNKINMSYDIFANIIFMGGTYTDHFVIADRDYNMGSGFSIKLNTKLEFSRIASFFVGVEHYQIYTWKGYPNEQNPIPPDISLVDLNAQGNKGHTALTIINPRVDLNLSSKLQLSLCPHIYLRDSYYKYFDDVSYRTFETRLSLTYKF